MAGNVQAQIETVFRQEHGRVIAAVISQLGDFSLAEDALQDALVIALERWPSEGLPRNPVILVRPPTATPPRPTPVPITPFETAVPAGLLPPKRGVGEVSSVIIADGVRQVDYREREMDFVSELPSALVEQVLDQPFAVLEED